MKLGPFSTADLVALWRSVVDSEYGRRFIEAGEGLGFEAYTQAFEQWRWVSEVIDRSTQAMFILPHSMQTSPPASGAQRATVDITFERVDRPMDRAIVLTPDVVVEEEGDDMSPSGTLRVLTGRRYAPATPIVLGPGQPGPVTVRCVATRAGYTFNHARVDSITSIDDVGAGTSNTGASLVPGVAVHSLNARQIPNVPTLGMVGKYVQFFAGSNAGQVRRIAGYGAPIVDGPDANGGALLLAPTAQWTLQSQTGTFQVGEAATSANGRWIVWYCDANVVVMDRVSGFATSGDFIDGDISGAQAELDGEDQSPDLIAESGTASWRVMDYAVEFGLTCTNAAEPEGGASAMLDLIGWERKVFRTSGENDKRYRKRVHTPADIISPNAIRRAANRVLAPLGYTAFLRETGLATMRGIYADGDPNSVDSEIAFAYDLDFTVRPEDRFKLAMDYTEFRAFMMIEVPRIGSRDFGIAYDAGPSNAYDAAPFNAFADGYSLEAQRVYREVWNAVEGARGAGVGFDLVQVPEA